MWIQKQACNLILIRCHNLLHYCNTIYGYICTLFPFVVKVTKLVQSIYVFPCTELSVIANSYLSTAAYFSVMSSMSGS